jgi:hypothetical protein
VAQFGWRDVDCFFRPQALECDRALPGRGLLFLFMSSLSRAFGLRGFFADPGKGHFPLLQEVISPPTGISFTVRFPASRNEVGAIIRELLASHGGCIAPANLRRLPYFRAYEREDRAHYFLVKGYHPRNQAYEVADYLHLSADHSSTNYGLTMIPAHLLERMASDYWTTYIDHAPANPYRTAYYWVLAVAATSASARRDGDDIPRIVRSQYLDAIRQLEDSTVAKASLDERRLAELEAAASAARRDVMDATMRSYLAEANFVEVHLTILLRVLRDLDERLYLESASLVDSWRRFSMRERSNLLIAALLPAGVPAPVWRETRAPWRGSSAPAWSSYGMCDGSATEVEAALAGIVRRVLRRDRIPSGSGFFEAGGDSLSWLQFVVEVQRCFNVNLGKLDTVAGWTLDDIKRLIVEHLDARHIGATTGNDRATILEHLRRELRPRQELVTGSVRPIANRSSYFLRRKRGLTRWNVSTGVLRATKVIDPGALAAATRTLVTHHDALRMQLLDPVSLEQTIVPPETVNPLILVDGATLGDEQLRHLVFHAVTEIRNGFAFPGELFKVLYVSAGRDRSFLIVIAHHLLVDAYSFRILVDDLMDFHDQYLEQGHVRPPPKTTSFQDFSSASTRYWLLQADEETRHWLTFPWHKALPLAPEMEDSSPDRQAEAHTVNLIEGMPVNPPRFIDEVAAKCGYRLSDIVVAGIARAFYAWTGHRFLCIAMLFHGRESFLDTVDLTRTIGWISETVPLIIPTTLRPDELIEEIRRQIDCATSRGKSFGVLRFLSPGGEEATPLGTVRLPVISLNMMLGGRRGPFAGLTRDDSFDVAFGEDPAAERVFLVSGGVYFRADELCISWDFSSRLFHASSVAAFTRMCLLETRELIHRLARRAQR